jgi:protein-S-isoprenylcysteine O-methyltransferase Ste14
MLINITSDDILMNLRKSEGNGYHIPKGFFFKYVSSPNYFGEIIEWFGWSLLSMSPAGFVFFIWTTANLVPRARSNNEWSKSNIPDYPKNRKSIIPFIY